MELEASKANFILKVCGLEIHFFFYSIVSYTELNGKMRSRRREIRMDRTGGKLKRK